MKLNHLGAIIDPNVGDAELTRLDFNPNGVSLHINLALDGGIFILSVIHPIWLSLSTNCPQNVIESIVVTSDWIEAATAAPQGIRDMLLGREQTIGGQDRRANTFRALIVKPVAGATLTCIAEEVVATSASNST